MTWGSCSAKGCVGIKFHRALHAIDAASLFASDTGEGAFGKVHAGTLKRSESEKAPVATTEGGASRRRRREAAPSRMRPTLPPLPHALRSPMT